MLGTELPQVSRGGLFKIDCALLQLLRFELSDLNADYEQGTQKPPDAEKLSTLINLIYGTADYHRMQRLRFGTMERDETKY